MERDTMDGGSRSEHDEEAVQAKAAVDILDNDMMHRAPSYATYLQQIIYTLALLTSFSRICTVVEGQMSSSMKSINLPIR